MGPRVTHARALAAVGALVVACCAVSFGWAGDSSDSIDRVIALLATAVTLVTLVLALAYRPSAVWPPVKWVVAPWLAATLAASALAAVVSLTALVPDHLRLGRQVSLATGFAGLTFALGIYTSIRLLVEAGGANRRVASAALLAHGWRAAERRSKRAGDTVPAVRREVDEAFELALSQAIAADDVAAVIERVLELRYAAGVVRLRDESNPAVMRHAMLTNLRVTSLVLRWLAARPASDAESTRVLFAALLESTQTLCSRYGNALESEQTQIAVAIYLGRITRMYGWAELAVLAQFDAGAYDAADTAVGAVVSGCQSARHAFVSFVDPDPPSMMLRATKPWEKGLSSPAAMSLFLWGLADPSSSSVGRSLYAYHEVLTGEKFRWSFSASDVCMLSEIEKIVRTGEQHGATRAHLAEVGGIRQVAADLLVALVASWPTRGRSIPRGLQGDLDLELPPYRRAKEVRWFTLLGDLRLSSAEEGLQEYLALVCEADLPEVRSLAVWAKRHYDQHIERYGSVVGEPRSVLAGERPTASAVAVALRLMPLDGGAPEEALRFLRLLPDPVLGEVRDYCVLSGLASRAEAGGSSDAETIVAALRFVQETEI